MISSINSEKYHKNLSTSVLAPIRNGEWLFFYVKNQKMVEN